MTDDKNITLFTTRLDALPFLPAPQRAKLLAAVVSDNISAQKQAWDWLEKTEYRLKNDPLVQKKLQDIVDISSAKVTEINIREGRAATRRAEAADRSNDQPVEDLLAGI